MKTTIKTFNFYKRNCQIEMYNKIVNHLIEIGYKPKNNLTFKISFDCRTTRKNYFNSFLNPYPYSIRISTNK